MPSYIPEVPERARIWIRFVFLLLAVGLLCWVLYGLRVVFTPLLFAAALAYVLNPLVTWFERRWGVQRLITVIVVFALTGGVLIGGGFFLYSKLVAQVEELQQNFPQHIETLRQWVQPYEARFAALQRPSAPRTAATEPSAGVPTAESATTTAPITAAPPLWSAGMGLVRDYGLTVGGRVLQTLRQAFSNVLSLLSLLVLVPLFTFYFLWRFNDFVATMRDYLPAAYRPGIVHVARTIDVAVASFFRGRLLVCLAIGITAAVGWAIVGIPYSVPLGVLTGAFSLVPFLSLLVLPPALISAYLSVAGTQASWVTPVVATMGVYALVQLLETVLFAPVIQGRSTGLHPLMIVVALLIGAELAGLLGLLLAIPVASTLRTLANQLLLPELRRLATTAPVEEESEQETVGSSERASH